MQTIVSKYTRYACMKQMTLSQSLFMQQDELPAANLFGKRPYTVTHNDLERDVPSRKYFSM